MRDKQALTKTLIDQLDPALGITADEASKSWLSNPRNQGGMRLTKEGYNAFIQLLQIDHYDYDVDPHDLNSKMLVDMDRRLQQPYFIVAKKRVPVRIVFFGSREAMMANLYGNIKKFIDNYRL